jgi:hypothetical protein
VTGELLPDDGTSPDSTRLRLPTRLAPPPDVSPGTVLMGPTLMWLQDGRVVDVGVNMTENPVELRSGSDPLQSDAEDYRLITCAPDDPVEDGAIYSTELPAGEYEVRAFDVLWTEGYTVNELIYSDPLTVVLDDTGALRSVQAGG